MIDTTAVKIGGKTAYRADVRLSLTTSSGAKAPLRITQVVLSHGDATVVVTVTATDDSDGVRLLDTVARSIRAL